MGNARIPGGTEAMLGLHGWCSQTRKGQSEGGTEAAHPGACGMVGGMAGGSQVDSKTGLQPLSSGLCIYFWLC